MQRDFCGPRDAQDASCRADELRRNDFSTPKKTAVDAFQIEPKRVARDDPNRTKTTPPSMFDKATGDLFAAKDDAGLVEASSCEVIRLRIPPSYFFESQISNISPFEVPLEPTPASKTSPAPVTINQNVINSQPLELNLDEIDTMSFEADCETTERVLNPNNITGIQKLPFPSLKSAKNSLDSRKQDTMKSFFKVKLGAPDGLCQGSRGCTCDGRSRKGRGESHRSQGDGVWGAKANNRRGKYISNRMKFEKQGQRGLRGKRKCFCLSLVGLKRSKNKKPLFVSEFLEGERLNIQIGRADEGKFGNLDLGRIEVKKRDFF